MIILGASLSGKSTTLVKLFKNIQLFDYPIDRVIVFYYHTSPLYLQLGEALEAQGIKLEMIRYGAVPLDQDHLSLLRSEKATPGSYALIVFDDATDLVEKSADFNHLIHVARHSGLLFILIIHGIVFNRPTSRSMVTFCIQNLNKIIYLELLKVNAVRYLIFTISMRAKQMVTRFAQLHADRATVGYILI